MKQQSVAKGFAVLSVAGIFVKLLSLLYIPFLLAIIGEEGNGIYAAAYQVYVLVYVLTNSGIPVAISKLVSELLALNTPRDALRSFKIARFLLLISGTVMSVLMLASAYPLSRMLHFEKSYLAILALSPTLLITAVASSYRGYFQGRGNMTPTAVSQIIEQVVNTAFTLVFAALLIRYGVEAACAGGTIGTSLGALFSMIYLVHVYNKNKEYDISSSSSMQVKRYSYRQLTNKIISYSVPITLAIGLQYAGNLVDLWNTKVRLLVANFSDTQATEMYSHLYKYQQLLNTPIALMAALSATILPAVSAAVALKDKVQVQSKVDFAFRVCFLITLPSAVGFSVLSGPIFKLLKYGPGAELMLVGSSALVFLAVVQIQTSILQGSGKFYTAAFHLILGIIGKIATNYFLIAIPSINVSGAIAGSIVGYLIPIALNLRVMRRSMKIKNDLVSLAIKPLAVSLLMGSAVYAAYFILSFAGKGYLANAAATLISISIGIVVYLYGLILVKGINKEDFDLLPSSLVRFIPKPVINKIKLR